MKPIKTIAALEDSEAKVATLSLPQITSGSFQRHLARALLLISFPNPALLTGALGAAAGQSEAVLAGG